MFLATSNGLIGASNAKVLLGVGNGFVDSELEEEFLLERYELYAHM
jgi:hypothetical protein